MNVKNRAGFKWVKGHSLGSKDGSLTHFFVDPLDDSIAYPRESGQLANPNPIYKGYLKNLIALLTLGCLNLTDIRGVKITGSRSRGRFY